MENSHLDVTGGATRDRATSGGNTQQHFPQTSTDNNKLTNLQNYNQPLANLGSSLAAAASANKMTSIISPVGVTKITVPKSSGTSILSQDMGLLYQNASTWSKSKPFSHELLLNEDQNASSALYLKSSKSDGHPTYVTISISQNTSQATTTTNSSSERHHHTTIPGIQHIKSKTSEETDSNLHAHIKSDVDAKSNSIILQKLTQAYSEGYSSNQSNPITMGSGFPYASAHDTSMYSTQSSQNLSYMDAHNQLYQYQTPGGAGGTGGGSMGVGVSPQALGVAHQAQYLQPGQAANHRVPISHTTRASPKTVQWLIENYETADGVSLPRSTLYNHYLKHCNEHSIDAVNAASFGKLIRSVFLGLKTRRLGTRGNSKYHYYGIRVKPNSPLARLTDESQVALRAQPVASKRPLNSGTYDPSGNRVDTLSSAGGASEQVNAASHQQYLGDTSGGLTDVPAIDLTEPLPDNITKNDVTNFGNYYRSHCEALLDAISNLQFDLVEALWQAFYRSPAAMNKADNGTLDAHNYNISKNVLIVLCKYKPIQEFMKQTDYVLYQKLVNVLVPDVLRAVPSTLTQAIRNFAKSLENMLIGSMSEMPEEILNIKVVAVSAFSQTLRRYTSLNHLAQAARAVLQNPQQINQMWADLNKVDFTHVQEQSSWVCQCNDTLIQKLETDFKTTLSQQKTLEEWAQWLERVVGMVLEQHVGRESYPKAARQFLLNWSFYSSMIIRDLTLRSAQSFGSFHLIRLLYDEYMFYLIERKVAEHTGKSPLSVMGECVGSSLSQQTNDNEDEESSDDNQDQSPLRQQHSLMQPSQMNVDMIGMNQDGEPPIKRPK